MDELSVDVCVTVDIMILALGFFYYKIQIYTYLPKAIGWSLSGGNLYIYICIDAITIGKKRKNKNKINK